jgi:elongation factor P--beta-lysine ligase
MNYQKLDAALAIAVNQITDPQEANLVVFIHTQQPLNENTTTSLSAANAFLQRLGISNIKENMNVLTATVSLNTLSELSQQTWVQYIKLSQKLHLVRKI